MLNKHCCKIVVCFNYFARKGYFSAKITFCFNNYDKALMELYTPLLVDFRLIEFSLVMSL